MPMFAAMSLCACATIDGLYEPACVAYEGDVIELLDSRFTWRRFTDERKVGEHGELVEPFPDYPKTGHYNYHDSQLDLIADSGDVVAVFYLQDDVAGKYMLTSAENKEFVHDRSVPECALLRAE